MQFGVDIIFSMQARVIRLCSAAVFIALMVTAVSCTCTQDSQPEEKPYSFSPSTNGGEQLQPGTITITNPTATPPSTVQLPSTGQPPEAAVTSQPRTQEVTRNITVTAANSEFTIGIPPGYTEEREITASGPVDIWFKYLTPDVSLEVNGEQIQIPERRTTAKLGLVQSTTRLEYRLKNPSSEYRSYSLMIMPVVSGNQVPVVTREKWTAP